jgi:hypothetical protein
MLAAHQPAQQLAQLRAGRIRRVAEGREDGRLGILGEPQETKNN